jgi:hypothetical protein
VLWGLSTKPKPDGYACIEFFVNFLLMLISGFMIEPMNEQIDQFFRPDGTLISIPVKAAKKIAVLTHIAQGLSPTTKYPEKELNLIIAKYHDDTAAIRRHMVKYGILKRDRESVYWVVRDIVD